MYFNNSDSCYFSLTHATRFPAYRHYGFGDDGQLMIFESYKAGGNLSDTGARVYYAFPRKRKNTFVANGKDVEVQFGRIGILFDGVSAYVKSSDGADIIETPGISKKKPAPLFIKKFSGIILDTGYRIGSAPYSIPKRKSTFIDPYGNTCKVFNKELFIYVYFDTGKKKLLDDAFIKFDPEFRLTSGDWSEEKQLRKFLSKRCPQIDVTSLD